MSLLFTPASVFCRTAMHAAPARVRVHQNIIVGVKGSHPVKHRLKSAGLSLTARNISTIGVLCEAAAGPVCVKALIKTLVEYWSNFVKTEFPEQAPIELGSRVKLWAAGTVTHSLRDIGFAWGKEPRYVPSPLQVYTD